MNFYQSRLQYFLNLGFYPRVIYDIGACKGSWTEETKKIFPDSQYYLFEANKKNVCFLEKTSHPFFIALLGDQEKPTTFYTTTREHFGTGDSVFKEKSSLYSVTHCEEIVMPMTTLSSLVKKHKLPMPDLIKIDVQGAEKLVIQGGLDIIVSTQAVILELQFLQYNEGAPLAAEMIRLMDNLDFQMVDALEAAYLPRGDLVNLDFLFLKKSSQFIREGLGF